jgi:hypothetical protein
MLHHSHDVEDFSINRRWNKLYSPFEQFYPIHSASSFPANHKAAWAIKAAGTLNSWRSSASCYTRVGLDLATSEAPLYITPKPPATAQHIQDMRTGPSMRRHIRECKSVNIRRLRPETRSNILPIGAMHSPTDSEESCLIRVFGTDQQSILRVCCFAVLKTYPYHVAGSKLDPAPRTVVTREPSQNIIGSADLQTSQASTDVEFSAGRFYNKVTAST